MSHTRSKQGRNPEERILVPVEADRFMYRVIGFLLIGGCMILTWSSDWSVIQRIGLTVVAAVVTAVLLYITKPGSWSPPTERRPDASGPGSGH